MSCTWRPGSGRGGRREGGSAAGGSLLGGRDAVRAPCRDNTAAAEAPEEVCEALLLKDKGSIEVTRMTNFGTVREGGSKSMVLCIE